eukprot:GHVQ01029397.1.p1 GENE.GHVQ01029397.1~~GHVQ01029397.1.p1  ORF type:complete len:361 (-),score=32.93 GHVQ01029397.1:1999-3081(-)
MTDPYPPTTVGDDTPVNHVQQPTTNNNDSVGAAPGKAVTSISLIRDLATDSPRFGSPPQESTANKQMEDRDKWLARIPFDTFTGSTEKQFEDYIDRVCPVMKQNGLSPGLVRHLLTPKLPTQWAEVLGEVEYEEYEKMFSSMVTEVLPTSGYLDELEVEIVTLGPQKTVAESRRLISSKLARYVRICDRWKLEPALGNSAIQRVVVRSLPLNCSFELKKDELPTSLPQIWSKALRIEGAYNMLPDSTQKRTDTVGLAVTDTQTSQESPEEPRPCQGCGEAHARKECPKRKVRCDKCRKIGHIAKVCRNTLLVDEAGRPTVLVEDRPSGTQMRTHKDRTAEQKVNRASGVLQLLSPRLSTT